VYDDIIIIAAKEEECVLFKISKQAEFVMRTKNRTSSRDGWFCTCSKWLAEN